MIAAGDEVDVWIVERRLGVGGMGSVFRCRHRRSARMLAAVKVLDPAVAKIATVDKRFVREAEILHLLDHPNIVKVNDIKLDGPRPYIAMEYIDGMSLETLVGRGRPIPHDQACDLVYQVLLAVEYLHANGIFHRDLKPANVLLRHDGVVKLVDFGLALDEGAERITMMDGRLGTVSYAPPEWANSGDVDPARWDIYSTGVLAWELLTGKIAFPPPPKTSTRQAVVAVTVLKRTHPALDPGEAFPEPLRRFVQLLTEPDPAARPTSAKEALDALLAFYTPTRHVTARTGRLPFTASKPGGRNLGYGLLVALCVLVGVLLVANMVRLAVVLSR